MASLSRALRVAATRPPLSPAQRPGLRPLSSGAHPTAEKNVPYQRTLKEAQGPSAAARGPSRPLPSAADVVVIGGGSLGCQTLYHLAKLGVSGALLLERERLTSGTTWHTAGTAGARARPTPTGLPGAEQRGRARRDSGSVRRWQVGALLVSEPLRGCGGGWSRLCLWDPGGRSGDQSWGQAAVPRAEAPSLDRASWGEGRPWGVEGGRGGVLQGQQVCPLSSYLTSGHVLSTYYAHFPRAAKLVP